MKRSARTLVLFAAAIALFTLVAPAFAQEAEPVVTVTPDEGVSAGDEVLVTVEGMPGDPVNSITISTCFTFPVAGPNDCHLADFGTYTIDVDGDGAGEGAYVMPDLADKCGPEAAAPCQIVVSHGIGASAVAGAAPITYAAAEVPETTTTVAPTTTQAPDTTVPATTIAPTTTVAADDGGSNTGLIIVAILVIVGLAAGGIFWMRSRG